MDGERGEWDRDVVSDRVAISHVLQLAGWPAAAEIPCETDGSSVAGQVRSWWPPLPRVAHARSSLSPLSQSPACTWFTGCIASFPYPFAPGLPGV